MRLTRKQLAEQYPDQWLGLINVKYVDDDGATLESAEVKYTDKSSKELLMEQIDTDGELKAWYTNENTLQLGMVEVMG